MAILVIGGTFPIPEAGGGALLDGTLQESEGSGQTIAPGGPAFAGAGETVARLGLGSNW